MSIIHDALKKVQQSLSPKKDEAPKDQPVNTQQNTEYIYATTPVEHLTPAKEQAPVQAPEDKSNIKNGIKSFFAILCALAITIGSIWYLYQQYRNYIPQAQRKLKTSFYKLIHKTEVPEFKAKKPEELKPLAQITINPVPSTTATTNGTTVPALPSQAPITLDVHGIMANTTGNLALINDQVYQEGDSVGGAKIIKIDLNSITVNINGTDETIHVKN